MDSSRFVSVSRTMTESGTTVVVAGELDEAAGPEVRRALINAIVKGGVVDVDLSRVTFADSAAIRALLDARVFAAQYHVGFRLLATTPTLRRLLTAAGAVDLHEEPAAQTA